MAKREKVFPEMLREKTYNMEDEMKLLPMEPIEPIQSITLQGSEDWINKMIKKLK